MNLRQGAARLTSYWTKANVSNWGLCEVQYDLNEYTSTCPYLVTFSWPTVSRVFISGVTNAFLALSVTTSSISRITATPSPHECSKFIPARPFDEKTKLKWGWKSRRHEISEKNSLPQGHWKKENNKKPRFKTNSRHQLKPDGSVHRP